MSMSICDVICENLSDVAQSDCKIKEINNIILMFFFFFDNLWTSVSSFDASITEGPSKKIWKEYNSNFHHMIQITQIWYFVPFDGFSQITSHIVTWHDVCRLTQLKCIARNKQVEVATVPLLRRKLCLVLYQTCVTGGKHFPTFSPW